MASPSTLNPRFPLYLRLLAYLVPLVIGGWMCTNIVEDYHFQRISLTEKITVSRVGGDLLFYDEALTNAARMYALTGNAGWEERYTIFMKRLDETLTQLDKLQSYMPPGVTPAALVEANNELYAYEGKAIALRKQGQPEAATRLVFGPEYMAAKRKYAQATAFITPSLTNLVSTQAHHAGEEAIFNILIAVLACTGLMSFCLYAVERVERWRKQVESEIAQRHGAEQALEEQQTFLNTIITHLPMALFAKDARKEYEWIIWNKKAEELFGLTAADVLGKNDYLLFPKHEADFFRQTDQTVMREGRVVEIESEEITTGRGTWLGHTLKVPIRDTAGKPAILLGILEDITVRKRQADHQLQTYAEELEQKNAELEQSRTRAEAADRAKSDFLATMSHEIRTPLNGVIGTADLISRTEMTPQQDDYVRTIRKSAETLLYVINDILDLTKLEARQLGLEEIPFDFSRTVEDVVEIHSTNASKKEIDLLLRYAPGTPERIVSDPGRLRQVISNLLSNALKFTNQGHVMVNVEAAPSATPLSGADMTMLKISVQDTGIGIPEDSLGRIFDRFTQAESSTTRKFGGTGLGLAICKQLVELMGGKIGVESTPGQGSTFWFTLPARLDTTPVAPLTFSSLEGKRVLVVDDNLVNVNIHEEQLRYWGAIPTSFLGGEETLAWLGTLPAGSPPPFDLAIIDHHMPGMSGGDLGENLHLHPLTAGLAMLIYSSRGMRGDTPFFQSKGFSGYLVKPSRPEDLHLMLSALIGKPADAPILTRHYLDEHTGTGVAANTTAEMRVLVVEDDPVNQKVVRLLLEELGCDVHIAGGGLAAIEAFQQQPFDLVFMDMQMPGMDGPDTTLALRRYEADVQQPRTPIVALTANALKEHQQRCLEAGMDDYMTKPVTRKKMIEQLSRWRKQAQPATPSSPPTPVAEEDLLTHLKTTDPAQFSDLMRTFLQSMDECLAGLEQAANFEDRETWRRFAHRLKGSAANFGFEDLRQACANAESESATIDMPVTLASLTDLAASTRTHITGMLATLPG